MWRHLYYILKKNKWLKPLTELNRLRELVDEK